MPEKCPCGCCHVPDDGACDKFEASMNPKMCVYCDHGKECHPGKGPMMNGPLHSYDRKKPTALDEAKDILAGKIPEKYK